ncbi:6-phosphogluconolactonase [candidate division KSB1 bacterium]|nr:6-phosphogluconolactonase [candidate division KSB1 bacterium]
MIEWDIYSSPDLLFSACAEQMIEIAQKAIQQRGSFSVALSGGSTPRGLYNELKSHYATEKLWRDSFFFVSDERNVALDNPESNMGLAMYSLLNPLNIKAPHVFPVMTHMQSLELAARDYEMRIQTQVGQEGQFDLILLGLGDDGHTASLFPDTPALKEQSRWVVENWVEKLNTWRITFTYPLINRARHVMFLVQGDKKAEIVADIYHDRKEYPASFIDPADGRLTWLLDDKAGKGLK